MSYYTADEILGAIGDNEPAGPDTVFEPMVVTQSAPRAGRAMISARRRPDARALANLSPDAVRAARAATGEGGYYLPDVQPKPKSFPKWAVFAAGGVGLLGLGFLGYRMLKK